MHIVEHLIAERASNLRSKRWLWPLLRPALYKALGYRHAVTMADQVQPMTGRECFAHVGKEIGIFVKAKGTQHLPAHGPLIIVSNHPTGLADGLFMHHVLQPIRPLHLYLANADALRVMPRGDDIIIPVEWVEAKRTPAKTKQTLTYMKRAIEDGNCIVIFPSGRLARRKNGKMIEKPWMQTAAAFARKHNVPIVPAYITAKNSWLYYLFCKINSELRDITLFREMLNKGKTDIAITFGPVIDPVTLPKKSKESTQMLKNVVEALIENKSES